MAVFDVFNPLQNVTLQFTEEQLQDFIEWFDGESKPLLTINEGEPINVITIEQFVDFLKLKKIHRRSFHYPSYNEIMTAVEYLKAGALRLLTKEQFLYILNKYVINPTIKHELILAFKVFDLEHQGFITIDDIRTIMTTYGEDIFNEEETIEILRDANVHGDGNVFYEDFVKSLFIIAPELYQLEVEYLYDDADEDPSVPPEPEPEPEPVEPPPPPPPPPPAKGKGKNKK